MNARCTVAVLVILATAHLDASAQDHLQPESGSLNTAKWEWDSWKQLREVLLKDAASYHLARMVCLPSFQPEWMVTVVREDGEDLDAPHSYYVEYVGAEQKLFPPRDSQIVTVKKSRAPLDRKTAESLNKTWRRMLRTTRYPREPRLGADGVDYHFSRFLPLIDRGQSDKLAGWEQGQIWSPNEDSRCGELTEIGEALKTYALALPADRDKLRSEIRAKTNHLKARLDRP